ncbi:hypothetical protein [Actinomadura macra]|uniref:hypothetical protein n=1 Tax=Actinomadura macra TaxID=46164 RepID=UPI0008365778|nr:hypothetical protein [Actinomadura macra]
MIRTPLPQAPDEIGRAAALGGALVATVPDRQPPRPLDWRPRTVCYRSGGGCSYGHLRVLSRLDADAPVPLR